MPGNNRVSLFISTTFNGEACKIRPAGWVLLAAIYLFTKISKIYKAFRSTFHDCLLSLPSIHSFYFAGITQ